ncbi:MAG TPA: uroporphyrinogen decarboxylase family protein [Bacteroidota bacterium]|nr:uroporphyrinogen decarboxylase family protein [Bacteroidota bacterium]
MTPKERFLCALTGSQPDRLPVTTHHLMPSFLDRYLNGMSNDNFFDRFGLDPILWVNAHKPAKHRGAFPDPTHVPGYLEPHRTVSDRWRVVVENLPNDRYATTRYTFVTPERNLTMVLQSNEHTSWVSERLVKEKSDIDIIARYATQPLCDVEEVNRQADEFGSRGMVRGTVACFDVYGQPGCWQDASVLFGIEQLIMETYDDPQWVHALLQILFERKKTFIDSTRGAKFDIMELGGGDASTSVISPTMFDDFVAPYDTRLIEAAHDAGQRIVYHTCGGMMPILEQIADMKTDAMETFTPEAMGGDTILAAAKARIGHRVCMIGGFDQFHFFTGCTPDTTRRAVRECFEAAGAGGRYILSPSDHFFEAEPELLEAFADEARKCVY